MTTARDLLIVTLDSAADRPAEQGDVSLALAGAELLDLADAGAVTLDGDHIVPGPQHDLDDRLLNEAVSALVRQAPYESVEEWLWRRGRGLHAAYLAALEADGDVTRPRRRWSPLRSERTAAAVPDSPARSHAAERLASGEPVLAGLAAAVGTRDEPSEDLSDLTDDAVITVLAAVSDAVTELAAVRQRRSIEDAAFDNIWRGP
ncbi:GPP34 family phosphoprotein [Streptomyces sp. NPDC050211]|uniref:GOLPH3/VPS74 family protein n=1 Tax=Streptomyces sp. NPDC050211 TaxID=3154932 RepID=UPI00342634EC